MQKPLKIWKVSKVCRKAEKRTWCPFFVGNSRCSVCFRPFLCNCMCFACKARALWAFPFTSMLFGFAKVCVGDFKNRSASRADTVAWRLRQSAFFKTLQVSNCNKRVQKNSRMFGCLVSFIFICSVRTAWKVMFSVLPVVAIVLILYCTPLIDLTSHEVGVFALSSVSRVGNRSVQFGCRCGNVPYGRANRFRSYQITQTFRVAFSCVFRHVAFCRLDVTPFRRVQHLTIFYLERGRLTRGISCERVYTL